MSDRRQADNTFVRSCRHWSDNGRAGMDAFYRLATVDYQLLAEELAWGEIFRELQRQFGSTIRLLDVACGSGQFPSALLRAGGLQQAEGLTVEYDLLDPSEFSLRTARRQLGPPFDPSQEYCCKAQDLVAPAASYPVMWATHALYCVPKHELGVAFDRMLAAFDRGGLGFIAHASRQSHYLRFHDLYLESFGTDGSEPYSAGEQIIETLQDRLGESAVTCWSIDYEGRLEVQERETAERYLQRCLFDDTLSLESMLADDRLGPYLRHCLDEAGGIWRFPQKVWLIFFGSFADRIQDWRCG